MFKKLLAEMIAAETEEEITHILYRMKSDKEDWGVDLAFQHEKITWKEHEMLFNLGDKLIKGVRK